MAGHLRASGLDQLNVIAAKYDRDLAPILARYGLSSSVFRSSDTEIVFDDVAQILEDCAREWMVPDLGIQLAKLQSLETLGVMSLVVRMETSVRDAANALLRNQHLHSTGAVTSMREMPAAGLAEIVQTPRNDKGFRQIREMGLVGAKMVLAELAGRAPHMLSTEVIHAAPVGKDYLSAEIGCTVRYGSTSNSFLFRDDILNVALRKKDVAYHSIIRRYLAEKKVEQGTSFAERVSHEVFRLMSLGNCTQEKIALAMHMPPRSMQRRLKAENTSFREILDKQRQRKAQAYVEQTDLPLSEVALSVGYSDQTAFNQAFRRWFGRAPLKMRRHRRLLAAG